MTDKRIREAHERREVRRALRGVSRMLRIFAVLLIGLGAAGLILGHRTDWFFAPSWFSLIVGVVLFLASIVQRVRRARRLPAGIPNA